MPTPGLLWAFAREVMVRRSFPREPEPDLIMQDSEQVMAYAEAGRVDGVMAASYLFHSARISQTIAGCRTVLDLGCGPATQLAQIAELNPAVRFLGVDLSEVMLQDARCHIAKLGLPNVSVVQDDICRLDSVSDQSVDAVISTMALHHLPSHLLLEACFRQVRRVLRPGGAIYMVDFGRLKSLKSVLYFAYMNASHQPHSFSLDYERSLRAAFLKEDFERAAAEHLPSDVRVESTFQVPFLVVTKTGDRPLSEAVRQKVRAMKSALPPRYRRDLNDMRIFFALGGLKNDPF